MKFLPSCAIFREFSSASAIIIWIFMAYGNHFCVKGLRKYHNLKQLKGLYVIFS